ncbi:MAG: Bifunctional enzyme IspD/IspF [Alphaproteobacteria bacterium MarineAlpha2_Bin1]|nr:MAG: Bifunctional enzyme IspD/IspF [Alphaproteobacteria bacterium MarineAlpha2_Bin1]
MIISTLLLAGGKSSRLSNSKPKQYLKINDLHMICYSLDKFLNHPKINNVQIVINKIHKKYFEEVHNIYLSKGINLSKPIIGGSSRQESVFNGLSFLSKERNKPDFVIIHDVARPFVYNQIIDSLISEVRENLGVVPFIPIYDSIKKFNKDKKKYDYIDRNMFIKIQTPQIFCFKSLYKSNLKIENFNIFPDDSSIAENNNMQINFIKGNDKNFKITTKSDLEKANMMTRKNDSNLRIGQGFDVHQFTSGSFVKLGGVVIPFSKTLLGNSDADVVLHSLTDALLGALGKGDIGEHFPDDSNQWNDADSSIFLNHAMKLLEKNNGNIINIDITIICEKPKIDIYKIAIKKQISILTKTNMNHINIKATTTEKLGFLGREEGIACQTIVLIKK